MPKCLQCGGEIIEIPMDPEGVYTYSLCSNDDCPSNSESCISEDDIFSDVEEYLQSPATDQPPAESVLRSGLARIIRQRIMDLNEAGDILQARSLLESAINLFLFDNKIPPGRRFATESQKYGLGMKGMALRILNTTDPMDVRKLKLLTITVFEWLLQTEDELKQYLNERLEHLSHLLKALEAMISGYKDSPANTKIRHDIKVILLALAKIDREGSPPVISTQERTA